MRKSATCAWGRRLGLEKGHRYGTILCDLGERRVVDLLPEREAETVAGRLREHPGTEIVNRDRGGIYAEATRRAVPRAVQIADRWHLRAT